MTGYIQPPPPQPRGMGCFGKGCLILCVLFLVLLIAGAIGIYYGFRSYSALGHGIAWAQNAHVLATEPSPVPQFHTTEQNIEASAQKWHQFESESRHDETAHVELTADDLNNLIAKNPHARGKAFVSMENNRMHIQTSVPLGEYLGRNGYFLNGDIVIQTDGPHSAGQPSLNSITINGRSLPSDMLNWTYKGRSLTDYTSSYRHALNTFEIRDGKLILDKR